jgi:flagellin
MGYLETGMRVLDAASALLSRLQELAVLGANNTNTVADHEAINSEAEAIADEFNRLMSTSKYKGKNMFVTTAGSEYVSMGGRNSEMTFGIATIDYSALYAGDRAIDNVGGPSDDVTKINLVKLPSDGVVPKPVTIASLNAGIQYEITAIGSIDATAQAAIAAASDIVAADVKVGAVFTATADDVAIAKASGSATFTGRVVKADAGTVFDGLQEGSRYKISSLGNLNAAAIAEIVAASELTATSQVVVGAEFTVKASQTLVAFDSSKNFTGEIIGHSSSLTSKIEAVQASINTARVQAGSQYAAIESAVSYTTDLTAQYELGFNTVSDVNFSMETAHLAKNQILQQAATAMLAQANQGQQGLLQLIQG